MMLKISTIRYILFIRVSVSFPWMYAIQRIQSFFHREILSAKQVLPCGRTVNFLTAVAPVRNSVVLSSKNDECPCHHKNFYNGKKHRGCTKYITIPDDLRLSVDRNSKYFRSTYSLRTECERYNSRFKNTGQERMWVRNKNSVANLNTLAHISLLAVAIAAITTHSSQSYRKLKTRKRIAWSTPTPYRIIFVSFGLMLALLCPKTSMFINKPR